MRIFTALRRSPSGRQLSCRHKEQAPSQPEAQTPPAESSTVIRSIQVVDVKDLKPALRSKADEIVAQTSDEEMQSLRKAIDASPEVAAALKAKGLNSSSLPSTSPTAS
jgi:hypothetical protein